MWAKTRRLTFFLFEDDGMYLAEPYVVDFTQVISVRIKDKDAILRQMVLQLKDNVRWQFQKELGYFYARKAT